MHGADSLERAKHCSLAGLAKEVLEPLIEHLRLTGETVVDTDIARLTPLGYAHLNVLGRYTFALQEPIAKGEWHPLRTSDGR
jgi:hypothetical protein